MKLSVIINTYNRRHALERTLPTLLSQDFPADDCEIVVVVDGSTDGTLEFLQKVKSPFKLRVIPQSNQGMPVARNVGLHAAQSEVVLFLDDDIICTRGVFAAHCAAHSDAAPRLAHGPIYVAPDSPKTLIRYATEVWYESYYGLMSPADGLHLPKDAYFLSNSSIRRETLLAYGGLDEQAPGLDDLDLGLRLWKGGVRFQYLPASLTYEFFVKSSHEFLRGQVKKKWVKGEFYIARKHPEYRPHSKLVGTGSFRGWKRMARDMAVRWPMSPMPFIAPLLWLAEGFCTYTRVRKAGLRLLNIATEITFARNARKEAGSWRTLRQEFGMKLPILLYHNVGPSYPDTNPELTISPERFDAQVRWLARRGYVGIRPADWLAWVRNGKPLPKKPVLLTFDDAYADLTQYALPVLERYGFSAAVFVITRRIGGTIGWGERKGLFRLMSADQICEWSRRGMEFGAHSRTHPDLTTLAPAELKEEVEGSKSDLEALLQRPVISFAYPYGPYNSAVCECVRRMYDLAFTTDEGLNDLRSELHLLRRTGVCENDWRLDLAGRVRWGNSPWQRLRARLRLRTRLRKLSQVVLARS